MLGFSFTYYTRMQYSCFWPIMLNIVLMRKLVPHFGPICGLIIILQTFAFKTIFPIMLALSLMLSETYYAQTYAGIIGLGLPADMAPTPSHVKGTVLISLSKSLLIIQNFTYYQNMTACDITVLYKFYNKA